MSLKEWYELNHLGGKASLIFFFFKKSKDERTRYIRSKKKSLADVFVRVAYLRVAWGFLLYIFFSVSLQIRMSACKHIRVRSSHDI